MKKLTGLDKPLVGLDGQPLIDRGDEFITVGSTLANSLGRGQSQEPIRAFSVAAKVFEANGTVTLEDADFALLKDALTKDQVLNNMAKAQALQVLEAAQDVGDSKPEK